MKIVIEYVIQFFIGLFAGLFGGLIISIITNILYKSISRLSNALHNMRSIDIRKNYKIYSSIIVVWILVSLLVYDEGRFNFGINFTYFLSERVITAYFGLFAGLLFGSVIFWDGYIDKIQFKTKSKNSK